tara:strand:- start:232 stop:588 length:357 start_codon:yes stop_codon:yes gene_type:complete
MEQEKVPANIVMKAKALYYQPIKDEWSDEEDWAWEWVEEVTYFQTRVSRDFINLLPDRDLKHTLELAVRSKNTEDEKYVLKDYYVTSAYVDEGTPIYDVPNLYWKHIHKPLRGWDLTK